MNPKLANPGENSWLGSNSPVLVVGKRVLDGLDQPEGAGGLLGSLLVRSTMGRIWYERNGVVLPL